MNCPFCNLLMLKCVMPFHACKNHDSMFLNNPYVHSICKNGLEILLFKKSNETYLRTWSQNFKLNPDQDLFFNGYYYTGILNKSIRLPVVLKINPNNFDALLLKINKLIPFI